MRPGDAGQLHEPGRVPVSRVPVRVAFLKMPLQKEDEHLNLNYKLLCQQPGIDLVPIILTASGGMAGRLARPAGSLSGRHWQ